MLIGEILLPWWNFTSGRDSGAGSNFMNGVIQLIEIWSCPPHCKTQLKLKLSASQYAVRSPAESAGAMMVHHSSRKK